MTQSLPAAVLFDLDGTLLDTAPDFHHVINQLLAEHQRQPVSYDYLRRYVSNGARAMVAAAFDLDAQHPDFAALHSRMLALYLAHLDVDTQPFPGIVELLRWLGENNIPWGVVTNKPECYTLPVMKGINLQPEAACIICPDHVTHTKPHPEALYLACEQLNAPAHQCVYIGDHCRDIEAGQRAGMLTIAATYGYIDDQEDISHWNSDHSVAHASEIKPLLTSLYQLR